MNERSESEGPDASSRPSPGEGRLTGEAIRWSYDAEPAADSTAEADDPAPIRNPEQGWGAVLFTAGVLVTVAASSLAYSVLMGGLLGLFSVRSASILAGVLAVLGGVGLVQGWRVYRGR